ncbi:GMC family oxidoreductase N-terminal domain-containing protein [Variovorax guangxiensis]|uniref:GMC family oxidoreductase n=1 Tax=Variovorax guangxiensis TaxID=1775474 RepID=UPI00285D9DC3|nr:GMC family oxidoreductase N-terminal domain-containing protein [Variovorax guangxiensis]MDR6858766.1 choline dehydrogenase [Variovorax guangxiensis]
MEIYDYIIIGAGSAGCVLARGLTDNPENRVLLLEAGPSTDRFWVHTPAGMAKLFWHKELNWNYSTEPMPALGGRQMYWPRGKGLGGSSSINGMIFIRGHARDFDAWRDMGNPGWGYQDVLPYFKRIEHNERGADAYRGAGGPMWISDPALKMPSSFDFIASAERVGIPRTEDMNGELHDGVGFMQHTIRKGRRQSAYVAFLKPVEHRRNLTVRTGCLVQRILFENTTATGVEVICGGTRQMITAAKEVIVSAGSLNSPKLLMLSGVGPREELQRHGIRQLHELPGVGANLQDHFYVHTACRSTASSSYNHNIRGIRKYVEGARYLLTKGGYLALGASQVAAFVKSSPEVDYADLQISFRPMTFTFHASGHLEVDPQPGVGVSVYVLRPKTTGSVTLHSANPADPPKCTPNFLTDQDDVRAMISGIRQIRKIMGTAPIAARIVNEYLPGPQVQTDEQMLKFMVETGNTASHQSSTCKMGADAMAVVDERLRVRGIGRLRVVDASIMPQVTSGNINAPTLMIAAKGSDMIDQDGLSRRTIHV